MSNKVYLKVIVGAVILALSMFLVSCSCGEVDTPIPGEQQEDVIPSGDIIVPVKFQNAENIGSVTLVLTYDSSALDITQVSLGESAKEAMLEYNAKEPGKVVIGIIDTSGISGNSAIVLIGFNAIQSGGSSPLTLESVVTHDATELTEIVNETSDGMFDGEDNSVEAPTIKFGR
jgi:hypothetical protein